MRKILILLIFVAFALNVRAQVKITSYSPSLFYTYGDYSNSGSSNALSAFVTVGINYKDFITAGFNELLINKSANYDAGTAGWRYDQTMLTLGGVKNFYPFYFGAFYSNISGNYNSKPAGYSYTDKLNVFDLNLFYNYELYFFGVTGNYISLTGLNNLDIAHVSAVVKKLIGTNIVFISSFTQSIISDGRNLSSIKLDLFYRINDLLSIRGSGAFGERAYFYDDEVLAVFYQNETQITDLSFTADYKIYKSYKLFANYTYADFSSYKINYFTIGVRL